MRRSSFKQTSKRLRDFGHNYDGIMGPVTKYIIDNIDKRSNLNDINKVVQRAYIVFDVNGQLKDILKDGIGKAIADGMGT